MHEANTHWAGQSSSNTIWCIIGWTRSYCFLWAWTSGHINMCLWVLLCSRQWGHLCESTASGWILDFWQPVLSHPCMLLEVFTHRRGPSERKAALRPRQLILFHTMSSHSCLFCNYVWCFWPWICSQILCRTWEVIFLPSMVIHTAILSVKKPSWIGLMLPLLIRVQKVHCNLVCIAVHASPDIHLIKRLLVILMGFYPPESVSKCWLLHVVHDNRHNVHIITVSSSFGAFFSLCLVDPWDCCSVVDALDYFVCGFNLMVFHEIMEEFI